ncbi:hypothetical protein [Flavobacterium luminosum]|uniref:Lipoprotein n=1 Tax=Flavobacterium luminosum TaxID=2949086 RepID=A0ABT0TRK1_9FLAO|nr:hypothetical protein [Flavobacterium sp. HXWNR70]MCL9810108.1 hypothetical protein [Flavobacterium sp. HXWNR70]
MKRNIIYFTLTFLLTIGCAQKKYPIKEDIINSSNSISLDAYESNDGTNRIKSVISSKESNKINLDGKEYEIAQFKSIIDTIKGEYRIKVNENERIVEIIRIR